MPFTKAKAWQTQLSILGEQGKGFHYPYKGRLFNFKNDEVLIHATCNHPQDNVLQGSTYIIFMSLKPCRQWNGGCQGLEERRRLQIVPYPVSLSRVSITQESTLTHQRNHMENARNKFRCQMVLHSEYTILHCPTWCSPDVVSLPPEYPHCVYYPSMLPSVLSFTRSTGPVPPCLCSRELI